MSTLKPLRHRARKFLPEEFTVENWATLAPWFEALSTRPLTSMGELMQWLDDRSELDAVCQEDASWRFIHTTRDTGNPAYTQSFQKFIKEIRPKIMGYQQVLDRKLLDSPFIHDLDQSEFLPYIRKIRSRVDLFNEGNLELATEEAILKKEYEAISSQMTVQVDGKELTLQQAGTELSNKNRDVRKQVYLSLANRRLQEKIAFDELFTKLVRIRHKMAVNAGYENFRDFQFANLYRFDYTPEDCFSFHEAIKNKVLPLVRFIDLRKESVLDLGRLRPWDSKVVSTGRSPGRPFKDGPDMLRKSVQVFERINSDFAAFLSRMKQIDYLDLESRIGKAPGGYNCPLPESGVPFIFMNASGSTRDVKTMMHEGGHAVHSFLSRDLRFTGFKEIPSEIAELASFAMEYFSYDHWDEFYPDPSDLRLARIEHLERVVHLFPWVATIDAFQHWIYTNPEHTVSERDEAWIRIHKEFSSPEMDWDELGHYRPSLWQAQLHLFKAPFYYVEYALAQLGAIAMWRNYKSDPKQALQSYRDALSLGYTRTIGETYAAAGIRFDFSSEYIGDLMAFLKAQFELLFREEAGTC